MLIFVQENLLSSPSPHIACILIGMKCFNDFYPFMASTLNSRTSATSSANLADFYLKHLLLFPKSNIRLSKCSHSLIK